MIIELHELISISIRHCFKHLHMLSNFEEHAFAIHLKIKQFNA